MKITKTNIITAAIFFTILTTAPSYSFAQSVSEYIEFSDRSFNREGLRERLFNRLLETGRAAQQLTVGKDLYWGKDLDLGFPINKEQGKALITKATKGSLDEPRRSRWGRPIALRHQAQIELLQVLASENEIEAAEQLISRATSDSNIFNERIFYEAAEFFAQSERAILAEKYYALAVQEGGDSTKDLAAEGLMIIYTNQSSPFYNPEKAFNWAQVAANNGSTQGAKYLGYAYDLGIGTEKDPKLSLEYWLIGAKDNDAEAQLNVASFYLVGEAVKQDFQIGLDWLQKSVEQNYARAILVMNNAILKGEFGLTPDKETVTQAFRDLVKDGSEESLATLEIAAIEGNPAVQQLWLDRQMSLLIGRAGDGNEEALAAVEIAAIEGNRTAQIWLGARGLIGPTPSQNPLVNDKVASWAEGVGWSDILNEVHPSALLKAAKQGNPVAENTIGNSIYAGARKMSLVDTRSFSEEQLTATYWFEKSALQGYGDSLYMLGIIYHDGVYEKQNIPKALEYLLSAYVNDDERGASRISALLDPNLLKTLLRTEQAASNLLYFIEDSTELSPEMRNTVFAHFQIDNVSSISNSNGERLTSELETLVEMFSEGLLTEEEFEAAKQILLGL